jgi:hypothetical protein
MANNRMRMYGQRGTNQMRRARNRPAEPERQIVGPQNGGRGGIRRGGMTPRQTPPNTKPKGPPSPKYGPPSPKEATTAQKARARVGHVRTAIQNQKNVLAEQRRMAKSGTADQRRKARMSQQQTIDRIKFLAKGNKKNVAQARRMGWTDEDLAPQRPRQSSTPGVSTPRTNGSSGNPSYRRPTGSASVPPARPSKPKSNMSDAEALKLMKRLRGMRESQSALNYQKKAAGKNYATGQEMYNNYTKKIKGNRFSYDSYKSAMERRGKKATADQYRKWAKRKGL